jgi:transcriptional regulator with XRE-family HTH domain
LSIELSAAFGIVLRRLRQSRGLTQEELGLEASLQRNYISSIELGEKQPTLLTIFKLSSALNIRPGELIAMVEHEAAQ